jgi:hypothetical protein
MRADEPALTDPMATGPHRTVPRSNPWLVTHLVTVGASFAAFALGWGVGNLYLGLMVLAPARREAARALAGFIWGVLQLGVVLLALGTIVARFSAGKLGGWDFRENWALVALGCYVVSLYAHHARWVRDFGLAVAGVVCFAPAVIVWFACTGGLHGLGMRGVEVLWIYWGGVLNLSLVCHATLRYWYGDRGEPMILPNLG